MFSSQTSIYTTRSTSTTRSTANSFEKVTPNFNIALYACVENCSA